MQIFRFQKYDRTRFETWDNVSEEWETLYILYISFTYLIHHILYIYHICLIYSYIIALTITPIKC